MNRERAVMREGHLALSVLLVALSGGILFFLGMALQVVLFEYRDWLGRAHVELLWLSEVFFRHLAHRPDEFFWQVVIWFWWPMVWCLLYSLARHRRDGEAYDRSFLFAFLACWLCFILFLMLCLFVCTIPLVILLADLSPAPPGTRAITVISWLLPAVTAVVAICVWIRFAWIGRGEEREERAE